jgi:5-(carboxyamino)imidazole ribonucleotide synthase
VVTYEFENVPAEAVLTLQQLGVETAPGAEALAVAQDRIAEKQFLNASGVATVAFASADSADEAMERRR